MTGLLKVRERPSEGQRCAYCREPLGDRSVPCPDCSTALHAECWWELTACPTIGCARDADFVERPRRYRDPARQDPAAERRRFKMFRAPPRPEEWSTALFLRRRRGGALTFAVIVSFSLVPIGVKLGLGPLALLGLAAGIVTMVIRLILWARRL